MYKYIPLKAMSIIILCVSFTPVCGQHFSPKEIEDIQDFYRHYTTRIKDYQGELGGLYLPSPYKDIPELQTGRRFQRPPDFQPYFWENHGGPCRTSNTLRDTLVFAEKDILIFDSPLLDFPEITDIVIPNKKIVEAYYKTPIMQIKAYRGYTARWGVQNDSLFLYRVMPYYKDYFDGDTLSQDELIPRLEKLTGQQFAEGKLFAVWVNGKIVGGAGGYYLKYEFSEKTIESLKQRNNWSEKTVRERQYTGHYLYSEEYTFHVENGIVKQVDHLVKE